MPKVVFKWGRADSELVTGRLQSGVFLVLVCRHAYIATLEFDHLNFLDYLVSE